jgi:protein transport protein SEC24
MSISAISLFVRCCRIRRGSLVLTIILLLLPLDTESGHTQWEPPADVPPASAAPHHSDGGRQGKRRQYAAGQTQAYYGDSAQPAYGGQVDYQAANAPQPGAQLFTPGLAGDNAFAAQQQHQQAGGQYFSPGAQAPGYPGQQQQQQGYQQAPVDQLAGQFGQMNVGGPGAYAGGPKPFALYHSNLLQEFPNPAELHRPPPEARLPPNATLTGNPNPNPDVNYQRTTISAVPTTSSLLAKSKIPLALVINPYRSVKEGEPEVALVTDTVIARCRRCRTYINPFVQFIDGGNRSVHHPS